MFVGLEVYVFVAGIVLLTAVTALGSMVWMLRGDRDGLRLMLDEQGGVLTRLRTSAQGTLEHSKRMERLLEIAEMQARMRICPVCERKQSATGPLELHDGYTAHEVNIDPGWHKRRRYD